MRDRDLQYFSTLCQSVEFTEIYSHCFFRKNFVKVPFLQKLYKYCSWFDGIFFSSKSNSSFFHCAVQCGETSTSLSPKYFLWNQLWSIFFSWIVTFTKFLSKKWERISRFPTHTLYKLRNFTATHTTVTLHWNSLSPKQDSKSFWSPWPRDYVLKSL